MRKLIIILTGLFVFVLNTTAQDRTITGNVTNDKGAPLEGVTVTSQDGKHGTQTDINGKYALTIPSNIKSILFSHVTFESQIRTLGRLLVVNVSLKSIDTKLEEVVVVGYGTQQRKAFTGSASKVDTKQFAQLVTPSIDKQLQGRAAGVDVTNAGGLVNTPAKIRIRGYNAFLGNADPLVVVDGVPIITGNLADRKSVV